jgi:hypothetical protein
MGDFVPGTWPTPVTGLTIGDLEVLGEAFSLLETIERRARRRARIRRCVRWFAPWPLASVSSGRRW